MEKSIFEDLVRHTIGPERYDAAVEIERQLLENFKNKNKGFNAAELNIMNQLLRSPRQEKRTKKLEKEWEKHFQYSSLGFEFYHENLYIAGLITYNRIYDGWSEIHYTTLTDIGKEMLKAFLGEDIYNFLKTPEITP